MNWSLGMRRLGMGTKKRLGRFPIGRERGKYMWFIGGLQTLDRFCRKFDEVLWTALLDHATVYARDDIKFVFKNGNKVKVDG